MEPKRPAHKHELPMMGEILTSADRAVILQTEPAYQQMARRWSSSVFRRAQTYFAIVVCCLLMGSYCRSFGDDVINFDDLDPSGWYPVNDYKGLDLSAFVSYSDVRYNTDYHNSVVFPSSPIALYNLDGSFLTASYIRGKGATFDFTGCYIATWASADLSCTSLTVNGYRNGLLVGSVTISPSVNFAWLSANFAAIDTIQFVPNAGGDWGGYFFIDNVTLTPNFAPTMFAWDSSNGGLKFSFDGGSLTIPTTAKLFWANGPDITNKLSNTPIFTYNIPAGFGGQNQDVHVPGEALIAAPAGATHVLLVLDPDNLVVESREYDNVMALPNPTVLFKNPSRDAANVSQPSRDLIKSLLRFAGLDSATITSTARSPEEQGDAMFWNAYKKDSPAYKLPGQQVLAVYQQMTLGLTKPQILAQKAAIVAAMVACIYVVGPANVSHHCAVASQTNVFDIRQRPFPGAAKIRFMSQACATPGISKLGGPFGIDGCNIFYDPAFHIEIPQGPGAAFVATEPAIQAAPVRPFAIAGAPAGAGGVFGPASPVTLVNGAAEVTGTVSLGQTEYVFDAAQGDIAMMGLTATQHRPGTVSDDEDTVIYLLDSQGHLLASNDDDIDGGFQSSIDRYVIPATGTYKLVVVTFGNDPILDVENRIVGWTGTGGSDVDFSVSIYLMPQLTLPQMISHPDGTIELQWAKGILQSSPDLLNWKDVTGATSPWVVSPSGSLRQFYRVRLP